MPDTTVSEDNPLIAKYRDLNDVFSDVEEGNALAFAILVLCLAFMQPRGISEQYFAQVFTGVLGNDPAFKTALDQQRQTP